MHTFELTSPKVSISLRFPMQKKGTRSGFVRPRKLFRNCLTNERFWGDCLSFLFKKKKGLVQEWLLLIFLIGLYNQLSFIPSIIPCYHGCLQNPIHQIDSKNEWLLVPASFTAKFGLVFVLTLESALS